MSNTPSNNTAPNENPGFFSVPLKKVNLPIQPDFKLPQQPHAVKQSIKSDLPLNPLFTDAGDKETDPATETQDSNKNEL